MVNKFIVYSISILLEVNLNIGILASNFDDDDEQTQALFGGSAYEFSID